MNAGWLAIGALLLTQAPSGDSPQPVLDYTGLGPAPLDNPRALFEWGRRAKELEGCTLAESAWLRVIEDFPESEWAPASLYSVAVCFETHGQYDDALQRYEGLTERYPEDPLVKDALFRTGLVLEELERYREAKKIYRGMSRNIELRLSQSDKAAVAIQRDIELVRMGRERRGVKGLLDHIETYETLDREAQEPLYYWIAKSHVELGLVLSNHAREIPAYLKGCAKLKAALPWNDETQVLKEQLDTRARDLLAAQGRYQQAMELEQTDWTLAAIYYMALDHEDLYEAFVNAPTPKGLDAVEAETYQHEVADRSYPILLKAYRIYHHGAALARNFRSDSQWATLLAERVYALEQQGLKADDLDIPPDLFSR